MFKEIIISIVIILTIVMGNNITQNYTEKAVASLTKELENLKSHIFQMRDEEEVSDETKEILKNVKNNWEKRHEVLAYYIEHDELEKVESNITGVESFIKTEEYSEAIAELDKASFVLKHIEEKYIFNLENIF